MPKPFDLEQAKALVEFIKSTPGEPNKAAAWAEMTKKFGAERAQAFRQVVEQAGG